MSAAVQVRERPILFNGEMVRAILEGRKTRTRRLNGLEDVNENPDDWTLHRIGTLDYMTRKPFKGRFGAYFHSRALRSGTLYVCPVPSPYRPGDRLWVRETWALVPRTAYARSDVQQTLRPDDNHDAAIYAADWPLSRPGRWRPSIHMPRWASRLTLEITEVRVERVREITEEDAIAEGADPIQCEPASLVFGTWKARHRYRDGFRALWDSINGPRGFGWDADPHVWAVSFRQVEP